MNTQNITYYGVIKYLTEQTQSGIIQSENKHYVFDSNTTFPPNIKLYKGAKVAFQCSPHNAKKVTYLYFADDNYADLNEQINTPIFKNKPKESPKISSKNKKSQKKENEKDSIKDIIKKIRQLPPKFKNLFYGLCLYLIMVVITICNLDRFTGLGITVFFMSFLSIYCTASLVSKENLKISTIAIIFFVGSLSFLQFTLDQFYRFPRLLRIDTNMLSTYQTYNEGVFKNNYKSSGSGKSRRSWTDLEFHTNKGEKLTIYCDFIHTSDSCHKYKFLNEKKAKISYVANLENFYLNDVLLMSVESDKFNITQNEMLNDYNQQRETIWLYLFFFIFPAIAGPILIPMYRYIVEKKNSYTN
jgi:hypothetical protein